MTFNPNGGYVLAQLFNEYLYLLDRFAGLEDAEKHVARGEQPVTPYDSVEHKEVKEKLPKLQAKLETQLETNQREFPDVFGNFLAVSTRDLELALGKYERDLKALDKIKYLYALWAPDRYKRTVALQQDYLGDVLFALSKEIELREKYSFSAADKESEIRAQIEPLLRRGLTIEQVCDQLEKEHPEQKGVVNALRRRLNDDLREKL